MNARASPRAEKWILGRGLDHGGVARMFLQFLKMESVLAGLKVELLGGAEVNSLTQEVDVLFLDLGAGRLDESLCGWLLLFDTGLNVVKSAC